MNQRAMEEVWSAVVEYQSVQQYEEQWRILNDVKSRKGLKISTWLFSILAVVSLIVFFMIPVRKNFFGSYRPMGSYIAMTLCIMFAIMALAFGIGLLSTRKNYNRRNQIDMQKANQYGIARSRLMSVQSKYEKELSSEYRGNPYQTISRVSNGNISAENKMMEVMKTADKNRRYN